LFQTVDNSALSPLLDADDRAVMDLLSSSWAHAADQGALPASWPAWNPEDDPALLIAAPAGRADAFRADACDVWDAARLR
jgi:hypothetical protein